jgi:hypothetical protein
MTDACRPLAEQVTSFALFGAYPVVD